MEQLRRQFRDLHNDKESRFVNERSLKLHEKTRQRRFQCKDDYREVLELVTPKILEFFDKHTAGSVDHFSAVDIGCGHAVGTTVLALHIAGAISEHQDKQPENEQGYIDELEWLHWYPTDCKLSRGNDDSFPLVSLQYLVKESIRDQSFVFIDTNENKVFLNDIIILQDLKATQYNSIHGIVKGVDPHAPGRYKIQLMPKKNDNSTTAAAADATDTKDKNCKSFKEVNIVYAGAPSLHEAYLHRLKSDNRATKFYQDLLDSTRAIDILQPNTWSNLPIYEVGNVALVTCTSLLTCLGYKHPTAWQDTMRFASKMLHVDGILLQFDQVGCADFGNTDVMQEYSNRHKLGLALEDVSESIPWGSEDDGFFVRVVMWKKFKYFRNPKERAESAEKDKTDDNDS